MTDMPPGGMMPPGGTMTPAQMDAFLTPAMKAMMTPAMQAQMKAMQQAQIAAMARTEFRVPTDATGQSFTRNAPCIVRQPPSPVQTVNPALVGNSVTVASTSGERVKVRYRNGEEREFHMSELGIV